MQKIPCTVIEAAAAGVRVITQRCGLEGDEEIGRGIVPPIGPNTAYLMTCCCH